MKFKKLSDDKFRCYISKEEMDESGIQLTDFMTNQSKAQSFVHDIVNKACNALDIKQQAGAYSVQMMIDNGGNVILTVTAQEVDLMDAIALLKESLGVLKDAVDTGNLDGPKKAEADVDYTKKPLWIVLPSIDLAAEAASEIIKSCGSDVCQESELYRYKEHYYMSVLFAENRIYSSNMILTFSEMSLGLFTETFDGAFLKEHGKLICTDAISTLAQLV